MRVAFPPQQRSHEFAHRILIIHIHLILVIPPIRSVELRTAGVHESGPCAAIHRKPAESKRTESRQKSGAPVFAKTIPGDSTANFGASPFFEFERRRFRWPACSRSTCRRGNRPRHARAQVAVLRLCPAQSETRARPR